MRNRAVALVVGLVVGAAAGYAVAAMRGSETERPPSSAPDFLFVVTGQEGTVVPSDDGFTFTFTEDRDRVVMFTDRPARFAGHMPIDQFLSLWGENGTFEEDPPNAEVELVTAGGEQHLASVEILTAVADGDSLALHTVPLPEIDGDTSSLLKAPSRETRFTSVTFFIDNVTTVTCNPYHFSSRPQYLACGDGWTKGYNDGYNSTASSLDKGLPPNENEACQDSDYPAVCEVGYEEGYDTGRQAKGR